MTVLKELHLVALTLAKERLQQHALPTSHDSDKVANTRAGLCDDEQKVCHKKSKVLDLGIETVSS
jgi:hypothetical protein